MRELKKKGAAYCPANCCVGAFAAFSAILASAASFPRGFLTRRRFKRRLLAACFAETGTKKKSCHWRISTGIAGYVRYDKQVRLRRW